MRYHSAGGFVLTGNPEAIDVQLIVRESSAPVPQHTVLPEFGIPLSE